MLLMVERVTGAAAAPGVQPEMTPSSGVAGARRQRAVVVSALPGPSVLQPRVLGSCASPAARHPSQGPAGAALGGTLSLQGELADGCRVGRALALGRGWSVLLPPGSLDRRRPCLPKGLQACQLALSSRTVWARCPNGDLARRYGVTDKNPAGDYWKKVPGSVTCLAGRCRGSGPRGVGPQGSSQLSGATSAGLSQAAPMHSASLQEPTPGSHLREGTGHLGCQGLPGRRQGTVPPA